MDIATFSRADGTHELFPENGLDGAGFAQEAFAQDREKGGEAYAGNDGISGEMALESGK